MERDCLLCGIGKGTVPAHEVFRDERVVAFLDIGPIREGHLQITPCQHIETFEALPADLAAYIMQLGQRLARAQKRVFGVDRVAFLFTGGDIPHAHAHLVPMVEKTDITSRRYIVQERITYRGLPRPSEAACKDVVNRLSSALAELND